MVICLLGGMGNDFVPFQFFMLTVTKKTDTKFSNQAVGFYLEVVFSTKFNFFSFNDSFIIRTESKKLTIISKFLSINLFIMQIDPFVGPSAGS